MLGTGYFTPFSTVDPARARGCLTCTHFHGEFYCGHVLCERDGGRHGVSLLAESILHLRQPRNKSSILGAKCRLSREIHVLADRPAAE